MTIVTWFLSAALVMEQSSPSDTKCPPEDNACKAALFVKQANDAETPLHRAQLLYGAYRRYLALFDETGERKHLCAARRTFDQSLAVEEQPDAQRAAYEAKRGELVSREKRAGVRCGSKPTRPATPKPPIVAARLEAAPPVPASESSPTVAAGGATSAVEPALSATHSAPPALRSELADLAPVTGVPQTRELSLTAPATTPQAGAVAPGNQSVDTLPPVTSPSQPTKSARGPRPRDLLIAGGVMLGGGLVLTAIAGYLGHGLLETKREANALHSMYPGPPTDAQRTEDLALAREYQRNLPPTVALALAAGSSLVIAGVLLGVGGKRRARAASNTALIPLPGGVALGMRF